MDEEAQGDVLQLPAELHFYIFRFLESPLNILRASLVCKGKHLMVFALCFLTAPRLASVDLY